MKKILVVTAIALLAGCVDMGQSFRQDMEGGLNALVGQNIRVAIDKFGYPDSQHEIAGDIVYTWSVDRRTSMDLPAATTTTGQVDGEPFQATTWGTENVPLHFHCVIKLGTDAGGVIKHVDGEGNPGGCRRFRQALSR